MFWLDNNTGISTAPTPPAVISLTKRFFTNGGFGEQPSIPEDFWFNMVQEELLGVLTLAGVTPDKSDLNQVAKAIQSIAFSAYPVGAPIPWPTAVPPSGFLAMTGQSFDPVTYPLLAAAYPSGVLPDLRAMTVRGLDAGKGIDVGRVILSPQGDATRNITGTIGNVLVGQVDSGTTGAFLRGSSTQTSSGSVPQNAFSSFSFDSSRVVPTAAENRVANVAFLYIVRAI